MHVQFTTARELTWWREQIWKTIILNSEATITLLPSVSVRQLHFFCYLKVGTLIRTITWPPSIHMDWETQWGTYLKKCQQEPHWSTSPSIPFHYTVLIGSLSCRICSQEQDVKVREEIPALQQLQNVFFYNIFLIVVLCILSERISDLFSEINSF